MQGKIIEHYNSGFASSPIDVSKEEIDFIILHECQCTRCGDSIFEMYDFPNLRIEENEIMCEDCYDEKYRETCNICEESYDTNEYESDHFVITEETAVEVRNPAGIYKVLEKPFFRASILTGFDSFFDDKIKLVAPIRINLFKKIDCGDSCFEVESGFICSGCVDRFTRKAKYIKSDPAPIVLLKRYEESEYLSEYTKEQLHATRQRLIHRRITCRGLIEQANKKYMV